MLEGAGNQANKPVRERSPNPVPLSPEVYLEIASLRVLDGKEAAFEAAIETARTEVYAKVQGCLSTQLRRGVERPNEFVLLIEWATLEDHTERFPKTPEFQAFRGLISGLLAGAPTTAHWRSVTS